MDLRSQTGPAKLKSSAIQAQKIIIGIALFVILVPVALQYGKMSIDTIREGKPKNWVIGSDGLGYYATLRSLMIDHDLDFANEFRDYNPMHHGVPDWTKKTRTGLVPQKYPIGMALIWVPFFLIAHLLTTLLAASGVHIRADGYSILYQFLIGIGSMAYGLIGLFYLYRIVRLYFNELIASLSVFCILLGTNMYYYLFREPTMSHIAGMGFVACFIYYLLSAKGIYSKRRLLFLGFLLGVMIVIRYQNGLFGIIGVFEYLKDKERRTINAVARGLLLGALGSIPPIILQMIFWKIIFGSWVVYSYEGERFQFLHPHILKILFSSFHGLISWTPMVGLSCIGLIFLITRIPITGMGVLLAFFAQLYINASWYCWWFGTSYGSRPFVESSFIFCLGIAALMEKTLKKRALRNSMALLLVVLIFWNLVFTMMYVIGLVPLGYFNWIDVIKSWGPSLLKKVCKLI